MKFISTLRRVDKLYIKYWGAQVPQSQRKSLREMADFFDCSTKTIRKVLRTRGPNFTKWELERLGLERRYKYPGLNGRQLKPVHEEIKSLLGIPKGTARREEMMRLRDEERMPYPNIALRFPGTTAFSVYQAILYHRQYKRKRDWGWLEK